ncbi:MAG TPA: branched-chain amino acid ABC transporter permease [Dehalococcoidales bacterium]|nr:branched-chain amino acid ABC transporter permease [Dehalococcoidales bacterium]
MLVSILDVLIAGLILGGIYALIAMGLSLQYGVARVLNVAHGEFIMLGAMTTWTLYTMWNIHPLLSVAISGPVIFAIGYLLHWTLFRYLRRSSASAAAFESNSILVAFGLLFIIQNLAKTGWTSRYRSYDYLNIPVDLLGSTFTANRLLALVIAVGIGVAFFIFLTRTRLGKAIRAAAQDAVTARLMGVNINVVLALCFGFGALLAGIAGTLVSMFQTIYAGMGMEYTVVAIIVVVLGGMGSIPGSFIGGFVLGIVGSVVTKFEPSLALVAYYAIFMLLLILKPTGIMGK